jgi:hypothetical protein
MIPHHVYYQLVILVLLWLCLMMSHLWPSPTSGAPKTPTPPIKPKRRRSHEPKPFAGLTHKPHCALCAQETDETAPASPQRPDPMPPTNRRPRMVDTSMHFCPHTGCHLQNYLDSCPLLVIVERETPDAAHTRHVGEDMSSPHACKCRLGQCSHGLSPHAAWRASPSGRSPHAPPPAARTAMRPRLLRGSVPEHAGLAPGPGPRGGPARSGGSGDPGARGQTFGVSTFSSD